MPTTLKNPKSDQMARPWDYGDGDHDYQNRHFDDDHRDRYGFQYDNDGYYDDDERNYFADIGGLRDEMEEDAWYWKQRHEQIAELRKQRPRDEIINKLAAHYNGSSSSISPGYNRGIRDVCDDTESLPGRLSMSCALDGDYNTRRSLRRASSEPLLIPLESRTEGLLLLCTFEDDDDDSTELIPPPAPRLLASTAVPWTSPPPALELCPQE